MKKPTAKLIIASGPDISDVRYATGFKALDPMVFLQHGSRRYLVVPALELGRAKKEAPRATVVTPGELGLNRRDRRSMGAWALALLRRLKVRRVVVSSSFPVGLADQLRKDGVSIHVTKKALFEKRAVKTKEEMTHLREAQHAAVAAMRAAVSTICQASIRRSGQLMMGRKQLTSEFVRHQIETTLLEHHCFAPETIVAGGRQGADPHERGSGPLKAGEAIVIDIFPQHRGHGYWGDITRTIVRGTASPELKKMYAAVRAAQQASLRKIKAGAKAATVHNAAQDVFAKRKYRTRIDNDTAEGFIHSTGHGVGLDIHEMPSVSLNEDRLRSGHVITVEPGLYYYDLGGIRIEDTVEVTSGGYRYLATCEKQFEV